MRQPHHLLTEANLHCCCSKVITLTPSLKVASSTSSTAHKLFLAG